MSSPSACLVMYSALSQVFLKCAWPRLRTVSWTALDKVLTHRPCVVTCLLEEMQRVWYVMLLGELGWGSCRLLSAACFQHSRPPGNSLEHALCAVQLKTAPGGSR